MTRVPADGEAAAQAKCQRNRHREIRLSDEFAVDEELRDARCALTVLEVGGAGRFEFVTQRVLSGGHWLIG